MALTFALPSPKLIVVLAIVPSGSEDAVVEALTVSGAVPEAVSKHFGGASYVSPALLFPLDKQGVV